MNSLTTGPAETLVRISTLVCSILVFGGCGGSGSGAGGGEGLIEEAKILIEHNATDEDTGFQGFADGEPWNSLTISAPDGEQILTATTQGGFFDFGVTEFFFETNEPENAEVPIADVLARMPEGDFTVTGDTVEEGEGSLDATLSHAIPAGPVVLTPADGAMGVDPATVVVSWDPVTKNINGADVTIVGYQVIVEKDAVPDFPQGFARPALSVYLPSTATQLTVPSGFLDANACYDFEVLAIEESGNQTLTSAAFETGTGCVPTPDDPNGMKAAKILIEHNATDEDTGFQSFADGDPWNQLTVAGPGNQPILTVSPQGELVDFGLTELFFETSEPENAEVPIADVLARMPAGTYTFTGDMVEGADSMIMATLSHTIPAGPVLSSPVNGAADVDPDNTVVSWNPVTLDIDDQPVTIIGYQVIVEEDRVAEFPQGFAQPAFSIYLPAGATSVTVPTEFMASGTEYAYEVLAIEASGNQTLSAAEFETL